jgi:two-component system sensor histidine kinase/response regulator
VNPKTDAAAAIANAQSELDAALARLAELPAISADRLTYAAHALNNYLMVVSTIGHVLRITLRACADPLAMERIDALGDATSLMKQMVQQLVVPGGDETPKLIFLPLDLATAFRVFSDEYEARAAAKQISLKRHFPHHATVAYTDRIALGAVIDNILSNALKYSRIGGTVTVRLESEAGEAIVSITDSGPGISDDDAARVFTRGGKLSARPTAGESSTGYGLAIAKDLTEALHGRIWFENEPAGGATFFVAVPLYDATRD